MIKRPISKTGDIQYLELGKIVVLLSFLFAVVSSVTDSLKFNLANASTVVSVIIFMLVGCIAMVFLFVELSELFSLLKRFVVRIFLQRVYVTVLYVIDWIEETVNEPFVISSSEYRNKLCVSRS